MTGKLFLMGRAGSNAQEVVGVVTNEYPESVEILIWESGISLCPSKRFIAQETDYSVLWVFVE